MPQPVIPLSVRSALNFEILASGGSFSHAPARRLNLVRLRRRAAKQALFMAIPSARPESRCARHGQGWLPVMEAHLDVQSSGGRRGNLSQLTAGHLKSLTHDGTQPDSALNHSIHRPARV